jgi:hypothetical protein
MMGVSLVFFEAHVVGASDFFLPITTWNKGIEMVKHGKLTPGSGLTFKTGGWFEAFEATLDLLPEEKKYMSKLRFQK